MDRADAAKVWDNDVEFDKWLIAFERKRSDDSDSSKSQGSGSSAMQKKMSQEDYLKRFAKDVTV